MVYGIRLQPLRVPTGWVVGYNDFREIDPPSSRHAWEAVADEFREDLLQMVHPGFAVILDLGWYPECDADGAYRAVVVRTFADSESQADAWNHPLAEFSTRLRASIVAQLEMWLTQDWSVCSTPAADPKT